jgi:YesN/AraC family two-component response regulator
MPELNGFSLIKRLGREYPNTKIIVMSGFGGKDYALRASELGVDRVLEKPFNLKELLKAVEELLTK